MPHELTKTVYTFDELSDRAKDRARDWMRQCQAESFGDWSADAVLADAAIICQLLGVHLKTRTVKLMNGTSRQEPEFYWAVESRDAGASFAGSYSYAKGSSKAIREHAPVDKELHRIADTLRDVQRRHFYRLQASISHSGRSFFMTVDVENPNTSEPLDGDEDTVTDAIRDLASWIHTQLEREFEYRMADEQIDKDIRANEYDFTEEGNRAC